MSFIRKNANGWKPTGLRTSGALIAILMFVDGVLAL